MDFYFNSALITHPVEGTVSNGLFTKSETTANAGVLVDNDFRTTTNFTGSLKGVRFICEYFRPANIFDITENIFDIHEDIFSIGTGGSGRANYLIIHRLATNPQVEVWSSNNSSTNYTKIFDGFINSGKISINSLNSSYAKYYVVQFKNCNIDVSEIILADGIFGIFNPDGVTEANIANLKQCGEMSGGGEVINKIDDYYIDITLVYKGLQESQYNKLFALRNGAGTNQFITVDNEKIYYDRLNTLPEFVSEAYKYKSTSLNITRKMI